jgi:hypothetical protein
MDHDALKHLVNKPNLSGRIARWIILLQEFNYEVRVKPGKANSLDVDMEFPDKFPEILVEVNMVDTRPWRPTYKQACLHEEEVSEPWCTSKEQLKEYDKIINYLEKGEYPLEYTER